MSAPFFVKDIHGNLIPAQFLQDNGSYVPDTNTLNANKLVFDSLGNPITNNNPNNYLIVPYGYSLNTARSFANAINDESGSALAQAAALTTAFIQGGTQDLQRNYTDYYGNSVVGGPTVIAFQDAASFVLGTVTNLVGLPQFAATAAGGLYNLVFGTCLLGNNPGNAPSIAAGYAYSQQNPYPNSSTVSNGIITDPASGDQYGFVINSDGSSDVSFSTPQNQSYALDINAAQTLVAGAVTMVAQGSNGTNSTTTFLYSPNSGSGSIGQVTSTPDANGDGGSSLRFATPEEEAALNGASIDPTQVTPNGDGSFTFGAPQADPAGLVNQLTVNGTFGIAGLTVTNSTTGATATVGLDNGSTTSLQEGRSVATGAPNEQATTTESNGQTTDSVFGQGAEVPVGAADFVALVGNGTSAIVDGGVPVGLIASDQTVTLGEQGETVTVGANLQNKEITGNGLTIDAHGLQSSNVLGSNINVNLGGSNNSSVGIIGTGDQVNGQGICLSTMIRERRSVSAGRIRSISRPMAKPSHSAWAAVPFKRLIT